MTQFVTESISVEEASNIQAEVAEAYGVDSEDVNVEVIYQTSGSITIDVTDDTISDQELAENLEEEIATLLGVHEGNVEVTIMDGVASYIITSDTAETAQDIHDTLVEPELISSIEELLSIQIDSFNFDPSISTEVVITVDTSGAENNLSRAAETLEESFTNQGFDARVESNLT